MFTTFNYGGEGLVVRVKGNLKNIYNLVTYFNLNIYIFILIWYLSFLGDPMDCGIRKVENVCWNLCFNSPKHLVHTLYAHF